MRTTLAAGLLAVAAVLGGAGSALAHDHYDDHRSEGDMKACGTFAGANMGHAFYGDGCVQGHWQGDNHWQGNHHNGRFPF
ncbi:hypothetical protein DT019_16405 [Streptomyces sp. SDr-06]|nr:hypothetical protein DT019_16405 [Streptomyces sp. SDr-06]